MNLVKILACVLLLAMSLSLTSCLRDAVMSQTSGERPKETTKPSVPAVKVETEIETEAETAIEVESESFDYSTIEHPEEELSEAMAMWIDSYTNPNKIIMTEDEIKAENDRVLGASAQVIDILDFRGTHSAADVKTAIERHGRFSGTRYDKNGKKITAEHVDSVFANRGLDSLKSEAVATRGIVTSRANLRAFPDDKPYRKTADNLYDSIQLTELHVGTPLWVLHESLDGEYYFVRSFNYEGWVKSCDVAVADDEELWLSLADPVEFVCVTDTKITLCTEEVDMGVKLWLVGIRNGKYEVIMPRRDLDGKLVTQAVSVDPASVSYGYLPYTYENFIIQAFKYEGTMYSWGGLDTGVDCSGFISNVMRTFGFRLPRDTKDQQSVVGTAQSMAGKTHEEIAKTLDSITVPTAVYYPGHVLFYLGKKDGKYTFIHAPQIGEAVSVTTKASLSGMTYACSFGIG